jgi:hypothetical protein
VLEIASAAATIAGGKTPLRLPPRVETRLCKTDLLTRGCCGALVPSTVVTANPLRLQTGRRHALIARWYGLPSFHLDRMTVHPPQPPWPQGFFGPARPTCGERR